jgi:xanthine dehydrogenase YagT iron-sulfur-binding subunit
MTATATPDTLPLTLNVNGADHELQIDPRVTLLDALREHLGLTGAKKGCDRGQCGACTVLVDGRRVYSCLTLAAAHDGHRIATIESLTAQELHSVQAAFVESDAFQCGHCTSGQIMSTVALLDEMRTGAASAVTPRLTGPIELTDEEIRERMSGNICRCGAYPNIVAAVRAVAGES